VQPGMGAGGAMVQILVVEDEVIVGLALREELQDLGVNVLVTNDAESALQHLRQSKFDAAIIDIELPQMRGDVFAKECRRLYPHMAIVIASGVRRREIRALFGIDSKIEVIEKPHDFQALRACLEQLGIVFQRNTSTWVESSP
jgi:DNA-binding NtrC family response regulator